MRVLTFSLAESLLFVVMDPYIQIGLDSSHSIPAVCPVLPGLHKTATAGYYFVIMNIRLLKKKLLECNNISEKTSVSTRV